VRRWEIDLSDDDQLTIVLAAVIGVILGGRLGYVLVYGAGYFWRNPSSVFAVWDGGMSFHVGLIGIMIAGVVVSRMMRIPWLTLCDIGAVGAPVGLFLGRIANFINGELWGRQADVPWAMSFPPVRCRDTPRIYGRLEGLVLCGDAVAGLGAAAGRDLMAGYSRTRRSHLHQFFRQRICR
jgi:phosphatidylglycerol:prolipoprotein diacylglycerol transferase